MLSKLTPIVHSAHQLHDSQASPTKQDFNDESCVLLKMKVVNDNFDLPIINHIRIPLQYSLNTNPESLLDHQCNKKLGIVEHETLKNMDCHEVALNLGYFNDSIQHINDRCDYETNPEIAKLRNQSSWILTGLCIIIFCPAFISQLLYYPAQITSKIFDTCCFDLVLPSIFIWSIPQVNGICSSMQHQN